MNAKEYLRQYEHANKRAERLKAEYLKEHELIDSVRSTLGGDGLPHGNGINKTVEEKAIKLADKALKWKTAELSAIEIRQEVFDMIWNIPDVEGQVLYERYINLRTWEEICVLIHYSWAGIHKVHKRALREVQRRIDKQK